VTLINNHNESIDYHRDKAAKTTLNFSGMNNKQASIFSTHSLRQNQQLERANSTKAEYLDAPMMANGLTKYS